MVRIDASGAPCHDCCTVENPDCTLFATGSMKKYVAMELTGIATVRATKECAVGLDPPTPGLCDCDGYVAGFDLEQCEDSAVSTRCGHGKFFRACPEYMGNIALDPCDDTAYDRISVSYNDDGAGGINVLGTISGYAVPTSGTAVCAYSTHSRVVQFEVNMPGAQGSDFATFIDNGGVGITLPFLSEPGAAHNYCDLTALTFRLISAFN